MRIKHKFQTKGVYPAPLSLKSGEEGVYPAPLSLKSGAGFTLIELMLVIVIIGLLATLAIASLNNARMKSRDAKRVADVNKVQQALELYFLDEGSYPAAPGVPLGLAATRCLNAGGWQVEGCASAYISLIQPDPDGAAPYEYTYALGGMVPYTITFRLESGAGNHPAGPCRGLPSVIINCP